VCAYCIAMLHNLRVHPTVVASVTGAKSRSGVNDSPVTLFRWNLGV
jgi:hypothetical protein